MIIIVWLFFNKTKMFVVATAIPKLRLRPPPHPLPSFRWNISGFTAPSSREKPADFDRRCRRRRRRRCTRFPRRRAGEHWRPADPSGRSSDGKRKCGPGDTAHAPRAVNYSPFFLFLFLRLSRRIVSLSPVVRIHRRRRRRRAQQLLLLRDSRNASPLPFPFWRVLHFPFARRFSLRSELRSPSCRFARNVNNNYNSPPFRLLAARQKEEEQGRKRK